TWRLLERDPELVAGFRARLVGMEPERYAAAGEALAAWDVCDRLAGIRSPTLAIAGGDDPATPPSHLREIASLSPGAHLVELRETAHLCNVERSEAFTRALVAGLNGDAYERGLAVRREVLGDAHVDRALGRATPLTAGFQRFITQSAWGEIWARPGLDP